MPNNDYDVLVFKILTYLYGCLKREYLFDKNEFAKKIKTDEVSEEYLTDVLYMMSEEGLIKGLSFAKVWGGETILANNICNAKITADGIHYLKENSRMKKLAEKFIENADVIGKLVQIVLKI